MIHNYNDWLNESLISDKYLATCLDTVIMMCLGSFSPLHGNTIDNENITNLVISMRPELFISEHGKVDAAFKEQGMKLSNPYQDSPDFWVNCGDFDGKHNGDLRKVEDYYNESPSNRKEVDEVFKKYGMEVSDFYPNDVVVSIYLPYNVRTMHPDHLKANAEAVVKFYEETQPQGLESFKKELKNHVTGNKFGL